MSRATRDFYPYSSKYDAYLAGQGATERAGSARPRAVQRSGQGQLRALPPQPRGDDGTPPQFTDFGLIAIGVPRNRGDPRQCRSGLFRSRRSADRCAPICRRTRILRPVHDADAAQCRDAPSFFHNGVFHTLREVLEFYAERDTDPAKWYPRNPTARVHKFDDLPRALSRQRQHRAAVRRQARRCAGAVAERNRRHRRVSADPDRRLSSGAVRSAIAHVPPPQERVAFKPLIFHHRAF